jgi:hypothetical protein
MQTETDTSAEEALKEARNKKAVAILKKTDGLRVLKTGTVGHLIAVSAVEEALREANWTPAKK